MMYVEDLGMRCDRHQGHVFLPNCGACLSITAEYRGLARYGIRVKS